MSDFRRYDARTRAALAVLLTLLLSDLAFVALHLVAGMVGATNGMYRLDYDGSCAEWFQHAKEAAIMLGLAALAWQSRTLVYGAWSAVFAYLLVDDHLGLNARAGRLLAESLHMPAELGLRPQDYGDLAISLGASALLVGTVLATHLWASATHRIASMRLLGLLLVFAFFGVGVDMLHVAVDRLPLNGLVVVEHGGEMIAMSLIFTFVAWQAAAGPARSQNSATLPQEEWARRSGR